MAGCLPYVLAVDLLGACLVTSREERIDLRPPVRRVLAKTAGFYSCLPFRNGQEFRFELTPLIGTSKPSIHCR